MPSIQDLPPFLRERRLYAGVAAACVAGIALGLALRPTEADRPPDPALGVRRVAQIPTEPAFSLPPSAAQVRAPPRVAAPERPDQARRLAADDRWFGPPGSRMRRPARPSFDCADARTLAEDMVCADRGLAAADRRLARAYVRAQRAGAPEGLLRAQQDRWLAARELAAREDPRALEDVYEARIDELRDLAWDY